tara:strand:+ start:228 stop:575 length:348 start_codon:yes stop_codon:yes gene_type:complete
MAYNTNVYDPDALVDGAAIIFIVSASITNIPDEVFEGLMEDPEKLKAMLTMYSHVMIKGLIEMGFDHDDVRDRAEEMIENEQGTIEENDQEFDEELHRQAKAILGDDFLNNDTED